MSQAKISMVMKRNRMRLITTTFTFGVTLLLATLTSPVIASETLMERVDYSKITHEENVQDLSIKVLGGSIDIRRYYRVMRHYNDGITGAASDFDFNVGVSGAIGTYRGNSLTASGEPPLTTLDDILNANATNPAVLVNSGSSNNNNSSSSGTGVGVNTTQREDRGVWQFHRKWHDLIFLRSDTGQINPEDIPESFGDASSLIRYIDRNDYIYIKQPGNDYYEYEFNGSDLRITETETGWRWSNREGDYIDYDKSGKALVSGNKNNVQVSLRRNSQGLISEYVDHLGNTVATWTYEGTYPTRVRDYTGREVIYTWEDGFLESVITSRGHVWRYGYDEIRSLQRINKVLVSKIDPEEQEFQYRYQMSLGGFQTIIQPQIEGDFDVVGGGVRVSQVSNSSGGSGSGSVSIPVPSTLTYQGKVYPDGRRIEYGYFYDADSRSYLILDVNSDGLERENWYDFDGQISRSLKGGKVDSTRTRPEGSSTAISTDAYGNQTRTNYTRFQAVSLVTHPDGSSMSYQYLPNYNFVTLETDEIGVQTRHEYDDNGNRLRTTSGMGSDDERVMEYEYDEFGQVTLERYVGRTNPDGSTSETVEMTYDYDDYGNIIRHVDGNGNVMLYQDYNAQGLYQTMIDGRGKEWKYTYDQHGNKLTETTPLGFVSTYVYDTLHRIESMTDAEGRTTTYEYDSYDNIIRQTNNIDGVRTMTYRMDGQRTSLRDESNQVTTYRYDRAARLIQITDGVGNEADIDYERGDELAGIRVASITTPNNRIVNEYDNRNRVVTRSVQTVKDDNLISNTRFTYTARNERASVTDPNGNVTTSIYNEHYELESSTNAENETNRYSYDNRGNLIRVTDALNASTYYSYDKNDNKVSETRPGDIDLFTVGEGNFVETQQYVYDGENDLIQTIDYNGNVAIYTLDDDGRPVTHSNTPASASAKDGSQADRVITYAYDQTNLLKSYADQHSMSSYDYDDLGRLIEQNTTFITQGADNISKTLLTSYHGNSQIRSKTDAEGNVTTYSYDGAGKLNQMAIQNAGSILVNEYEGNLPTTITYPGGTVRQHQYDGLARLSQIVVNDNADNLKMDYGYQFDPVGNIVQKTTQVENSEVQTLNYGYDNVYRTTSAEQPNQFGNKTFTYDNNSNRSSLITSLDSNNQTYNYGYNGQQELISIEKIIDESTTNSALSYDANGDLISSISDNAGVENYQYNYNSYGRVESIENGASIELGQYQYDPMERRISKTVGGVTTYFLYDSTGAGLGGEYNQQGELIRSYGYQPDGYFTTDAVYLKTPIANQQPDTPIQYEFSFYQNDHLGTPQLLVQTSGATAWQAEYDVFGQINETVRLIDQPLRFAGQYHDLESGLYYNWHRYYSPELGRYVSADPIGLYGGINTFGYAYANPNGYFDPNGQWVPLFTRLVFVLWRAYEAAMFVQQTYELAKTLLDPCISFRDKAAAVGSFVLDFVSPGPGNASKRLGIDGDDVAKGGGKNKEYGSYTNNHESGKRYHGQGDKKRSQKSGREKAAKNNDPHIATDWTPAQNRREAMKDEARRLSSDGGKGNSDNYNKINSPGKKYIKQDGGR